MFFVYILECSDGKFYVGFTEDFNARLCRHNHGEVKFTSSRLPLNVKVVIELPDKYVALKLRITLKVGRGEHSL
jgi:putative endonuclease